MQYVKPLTRGGKSTRGDSLKEAQLRRKPLDLGILL